MIDQRDEKQEHTPTYTWVNPWDITRLIRRPWPNSLKLSQFVELFELIILVINLLGFEFIFTEIQVKYYGCILWVFAIKKDGFSSKSQWKSIIIRSNCKTNYRFGFLVKNCTRILKNLKTFHPFYTDHWFAPQEDHARKIQSEKWNEPD